MPVRVSFLILLGLLAPAAPAATAVSAWDPPPRRASAALVELGAPVLRTAPAPHVRPRTPIVGERVTVSRQVPAPAGRQVRLEERRGGAWVTVARTRSDEARRVAMARAVRTPIRLRLVAPPVAGRPRWQSAARKVTPVAQRLAAHGPARVVVPRATGRADVVASATLSPARAGRVVALQHRRDGRWVEVARVRQGTAAALAFPEVTLPVGTHDLRVVATGPGRPAERRTGYALVVDSAPPRLDIVTEDGAGITSHEDYVRADLRLTHAGAAPDDREVLAESARLRVRGNTTAWIVDKLPYKIKLDRARSVLGMPASTDWVLLANFYDRSLMRNDLAFEVGRRLGVPWSARTVDVEVWLNGAYRGVYQLAEGIEVQPGRVEIETADPDRPAPDGGYLLEADQYADTDPSFRTSRGMQVFVKEPGDVAPAFVESVRAHLQGVEDALYSPDFTDPRTGYRSLVDLDSFAGWYLLNEIVKNVDSAFTGSVWLHRDLGGRLAMGPPWDFDRSAGNSRAWDLDDPTGWYLGRNFTQEPWTREPHPGTSPTPMTGPEGHWINRMLTDERFVGLVRERWREARPELLALPEYVARQRAHLADAAARNFAPKPGGAGMPLEPQFFEDPTDMIYRGTWEGEADALEAWIRARVAWLDLQLGAAG
ncbi:CotH kinase family protein [Nocardioides ochotonae]|uniref:CotH kinase family protein n=1 Tax=Nocardioides ochotonae TaxID=2685869 RepID=UPI001409E096|nr:CotH kinase family protein [Nocardioides ochotonae]